MFKLALLLLLLSPAQARDLLVVNDDRAAFPRSAPPYTPGTVNGKRSTG